MRTIFPDVVMRWKKGALTAFVHIQLINLIDEISEPKT